MKHADFDKILAKTIASIQALQKVKGGEYATDGDRLANFKRNAEHLGLKPEQIWAVYAGKHWDAIQTFVRDIAEEKERPRSEPIEGRIDDLIVYLVLFKGILVDSATSK